MRPWMNHFRLAPGYALFGMIVIGGGCIYFAIVLSLWFLLGLILVPPMCFAAYIYIRSGDYF